MSLYSAKLPTIVLRRIIEYATYQTTQDINISSWKPSLSLLSVSQAWRSQALPLVYKHMFIRDDDSVSQLQGKWQTNVDILKTANATTTVQSISIVLSDHINLQKFLAKANGLFSTSKYNWNNVRNIYFKRYVDLPTGNEFIMTSDPVRLSMQMTDFGRLITSSMPRIVDVQLLATRITLNSIENNALTVGLSNALGDMLWQKYAAQTTALKCNFYPTNLSFAQFDSLGYIEVSLQNKHQYCFANISANMLKRVCLTEVPQHFSLARFCGSCGIAGNNLVFGNLLSLNMSFSEETVDPLVPVNNNNNNSHSLENAEENNYNDKTCAISFPKLQKLMLTNLPATTASDAMFGSHYPEHLEVLKISSKMNSLGNLDKMQNTVSSICSLDLSIKEVNEYDQDQFSSLTNSLLGSQMQCQNASLTVTGLKFQLDDTKLSWTNITKLHIINLLDYHTLSGILTKCKKLRSLVTGLDIAQPLVDTHTDLLREPLLPLNTAIEALRIVALAQNANKKDVCEGLERLVVRLPGLLKLNLPANVQINMPEVVAKYKEVYPHLSNIAVFQGRPVALNRSNSRLRMLFANSRAPALTIQSRS